MVWKRVIRASAAMLLAVLLSAGAISVSATGVLSSKWASATVANESVDEWSASICGDTVVWMHDTSDNADVLTRDLSTGVESDVCTWTDMQVPLDVDEDQVVWRDYTGDHVMNDTWQIYVASLESGVVSDVKAIGEGMYAALDGNMFAWIDESDATKDVLVKDLDSGDVSEVATDLPDPVSVDISGDTIIWSQDNGDDLDLYMHSLSGGVTSPVCTAFGNQSGRIDGDIIVWTDGRPGSDSDVYKYVISTHTEYLVSGGPGNQYGVHISGDLVAWTDTRSGGADVYAKNLATGTEYVVCGADGYQVVEGVSDSKILYTASGTAGSSDLFVAVLDTVKPTSWSNNKGTYTGSAAIKIDAEDTFEILGGTYPGSGVQDIHYKVDDADWSVHYDDTYTLNYDQLGEHQLVYKALDKAGNLETPYHYEDLTILSDGTYEYEPVAGDNRYETSIEVSKQSYPNGADSVVVATAINWPDALGGAALAGTVDGPILLVKKDSVPAAIAAEIERLGADEVIILGGTAVVSDATAGELLKLDGVETVQRIGGDTRFETAELIAEETVGRLEGAWSHTAFMATGDNFPDALAAAPIAARRGWPIFLAKPNGSVPIPAMQEQGVDRVYILGGPAVVTDEQEALLVTAFGEENVIRLQGENRYETAVVVAQYGVDNVGLFWDGVTIATGENFPDALTGGIIPATNGSVMVLTKTDSLPSSLASKLKAEKEWIHDVYYLGGTSAISQAVRDQVTQILE